MAGFSQSYTVTTKNALLSGTPSSDHFESSINITNTTNTDIKFSWYKLSQNLQTGWTTQLCDAISCFDPIPDSNNFTLKANKTALLFSVKVNPNNISGLGKITLGLKVDGTNNFDTITTTYLNYLSYLFIQTQLKTKSISTSTLNSVIK